MEDGDSWSSGYNNNTTIWELVIPFVDPLDRESISLTCKMFYEIDCITRKQVTIALCYAATPGQLHRRFPYIESLKLKGKPRAAMFSLVPEDWGGYAMPWVEGIVNSFQRIKALHFRRMIVKDCDLQLLAREHAQKLEVLKLDKCSGFSTNGLLYITRSCRNLKTLVMEESSILEIDGEWLHELALNNTVLESLNFYMAELTKVKFQDLELIAKNCASLVSVKITDYDILDLVGFFRAARALEEFSGGSFSEPPEQIPGDVVNIQLQRYSDVPLPAKLCSLGFTYMSKSEIPIVFPIVSRLRKLDLLYALLDTEGHCLLLQRCTNLEMLETRDVIGDRGLEVLGYCCKKLKRLRIERGADEQEMEDEEGIVSQRGLTALAHGCLELEYLAVYVSFINNASLECIGTYLKNLRDFRLVLLEREETMTDLPLDNGVRSLLRGCNNLRRFALYLRHGGLTDVGLSYIGKYSSNIKWMLLGYVGESDKGILEFSKGCPSLQKLEIRGCVFSEQALARTVLQLPSLRYLWVQGYCASATAQQLLRMARPFWIVELIPARRRTAQDPNGVAIIVEQPAQMLAYYSLAGQRTDYPNYVFPLLNGSIA